MPYQTANDIVFTDEILKKMQKELVLEEDVDQVLKEHPAFQDSDTGLIYSSKRLGNITLWVGYAPENEKRIVKDIYKYRIEVEA